LLARREECAIELSDIEANMVKLEKETTAVKGELASGGQLSARRDAMLRALVRHRATGEGLLTRRSILETEINEIDNELY